MWGSMRKLTTKLSLDRVGTHVDDQIGIFLLSQVIINRLKQTKNKALKTLWRLFSCIQCYRRFELPLLLLLPLAPQAVYSYPYVGTIAPMFDETDIAGVVQSPQKYIGKIVVLEWINPDCPYVRKHYIGSKNIPDMEKKFTKEGVIWITICSSRPGREGHKTVEEWKTWLDKYNATPTALIIDDDASIAADYGVTRTPEFVIIDTAGKIAYRGAIDTIPSTNPEDISNPANRELVKEALNRLLKGEELYTKLTIPYGCPIELD